jgi:hypothetical protein
MRRVANGRWLFQRMEMKMRGILILLAGAILVSCTDQAPVPITRSAEGQRAFALTTAGKVPQPSISCLPHWNQNDMTIIDGRTFAYRNAGATAYVVHLSPGCELISSGHYALVSRKYGTGSDCRGDIQDVLDTTARQNAGSCVITEITPYIRAPKS